MNKSKTVDHFYLWLEKKATAHLNCYQEPPVNHVNSLTHCEVVGLCLLLIGSTLGKGKFWKGASTGRLV